jgi:plasmid stabilization system protein ParE
MKARFLPAAKLEFEIAADTYADIGPDLGRAFHQEVQRIVTLIAEYRRIGHIIESGTKTSLREFNLRRFPYRLIYSIEARNILIVAVAHQHRCWGYWSDRVEEPAAAYDIPLAA